MTENTETLMKSHRKEFRALVQGKLEEYLAEADISFNKLKTTRVVSHLGRDLAKNFETLEAVRKIEPDVWKEYVRKAEEQYNIKNKPILNRNKSVAHTDKVVDKYLQTQLLAYYADVKNRPSMKHASEQKIPYLKNRLKESNVINYETDSEEEMIAKLKGVSKEQMTVYIEEAIQSSTSFGGKTNDEFISGAGYRW